MATEFSFFGLAWSTETDDGTETVALDYYGCTHVTNFLLYFHVFPLLVLILLFSLSMSTTMIHTVSRWVLFEGRRSYSMIRV
jgi:hypothetical protein